jgi:endogenous inhibitor of DNA gyrase (YacG/DUF329 family)
MSQPIKTNCPDCGTEMNCHAVKLDYGFDDPDIVDPVFGRVLKETRSCPDCGRTELKAA